MMKPKFASSHDFLSVHHEYFVGTFASILLCPPTFKCLATLLGGRTVFKVGGGFEILPVENGADLRQ